MGPFSVVVGVITLIDATKKAKDLLQAVKNGAKEAAKLLEELKSLQTVLESYESLSKRSKANPDAIQMSTLRRLGGLETKSSPLARSTEEVKKLVTRLEESGWGPPGSNRRAAFHSFSWPFSQKDINNSL